MSDNHDLLNDMYSFSGYEVDDMCSNNGIDAYRDNLFVKPQKISVFNGFMVTNKASSMNLPPFCHRNFEKT